MADDVLGAVKALEEFSVLCSFPREALCVDFLLTKSPFVLLTERSLC